MDALEDLVTRGDGLDLISAVSTCPDGGLNLSRGRSPIRTRASAFRVRLGLAGSGFFASRWTGHRFSSPEMVAKRWRTVRRKKGAVSRVSNSRSSDGIGAPYHAPTRVCTVALVREGIMQSVGPILRAIRMLDRCPREDTTRKSRRGSAARSVSPDDRSAEIGAHVTGTQFSRYRLPRSLAWIGVSPNPGVHFRSARFDRRTAVPLTSAIHSPRRDAIAAVRDRRHLVADECIDFVIMLDYSEH